jgi:hypothetical protein
VCRTGGRSCFHALSKDRPRRSIARTKVHWMIMLQHVEGLVSLTGGDTDELLPIVTKILTEALLKLVSREEIERQFSGFIAG